MWYCVHNLLFRYITAITNQPLMRMIQTYERKYPEQEGLLKYGGRFFFKTPLHVWTSSHGNHMSMVVSTS